MIRISLGDGERSFGAKGAIGAGPTSSAGFLTFSPWEDGEAVNLLEDVANVHRRRRCVFPDASCRQMSSPRTVMTVSWAPAADKRSRYRPWRRQNEALLCESWR